MFVVGKRHFFHYALGITFTELIIGLAILSIVLLGSLSIINHQSKLISMLEFRLITYDINQSMRRVLENPDHCRFNFDANAVRINASLANYSGLVVPLQGVRKFVLGNSPSHPLILQIGENEQLGMKFFVETMELIEWSKISSNQFLAHLKILVRDVNNQLTPILIPNIAFFTAGGSSTSEPIVKCSSGALAHGEGVVGEFVETSGTVYEPMSDTFVPGTWTGRGIKEVKYVYDRWLSASVARVIFERPKQSANYHVVCTLKHVPKVPGNAGFLTDALSYVVRVDRYNEYFVPTVYAIAPYDFNNGVPGIGTVAVPAYNFICSVFE
ncbi:MAG: hypothetical protein NZ480_04840 [Bdellovibrionaceae bacterium]|nr:hypothetical protein [Pseudobdellovibrionaceae bacterium]MDW8189729.1 hypothetical protein [Pseudobdellovibrionaceae bacterium]